jgi:hypothetical protein
MTSGYGARLSLQMLDDPHSGSKVWEAPDWVIGKPGENRGKVIAHRDFSIRISRSRSSST